MTQGGGSAKGIREQCWRERIASCASSGKSIVQWCREEGIPVGQYHWWKRTLRCRDAGQAVTPVFAELGWAPVRLAAAPAIEVALPGERVVRVHPGFDAATLSSVVRVLEELGC